MRANGFFITKDFVLKACLYLYSPDIRYRVANLSKAQVKGFERNWEMIKESVLATFDLVKVFGFDGVSLTSHNALLPITYWIHHKKLSAVLVNRVAFREERDLIKRWLNLVLLKGIFGVHADTILAAIRRAFVGDKFSAPFLRPALGQFPSTDIQKILIAQGREPEMAEGFY